MLQAAIPARFQAEASGIPTHLAPPIDARTVLDRLDLPIVLMRSNRCVILANSAARRIEARGDCIRFSGGRLKVIASRDHRALECFLGCASRFAYSPRPRLCLGNREMAARASLLVVEWLDPGAMDDPIAVLFVHELRIAIEPELISHRYGLTRTEGRLVAALFVDPVLRSAAQSCSITLNTAKTHLKHVFEKCGVSSKAELVRLVALTPRTL